MHIHVLINTADVYIVDAPSGTRGGVEEYEAMEVDQDGGPGPQRCKFNRAWLLKALCLKVL